ncbi:MAG: pyridoxal-phosphate dependent enzyme, partial [Thermoanaerobaculia bacterium]|nr:pyridoxal-phosphate dependent enzyme [Thermoanaerobaculia bacterium]
CEPTQAGREEAAARVVEETGGVLVHPYDVPEVIAGQGTCFLEMVQRVAELDLVVAPIGGGGLLSGTSLVARRLLPHAEIVGAEPAGADDAYRSLEAGKIVPVAEPRTMADGLRATIGELPFRILREAGARIVRVSEEEIRQALRLAWERLKVVIEPSSAVALAALRKEELAIRDRRVGVILSGGNVTLPEDWP